MWHDMGLHELACVVVLRKDKSLQKAIPHIPTAHARYYSVYEVLPWGIGSR